MQMAFTSAITSKLLNSSYKLLYLLASPFLHPLSFSNFFMHKLHVYMLQPSQSHLSTYQLPFSQIAFLSIYLNLMAYSFNLFLTLFLPFSMAFLAMARPFNSHLILATRLQLENQTNCWESLFELQSCTGEVIMFFLNGEIYLGPNCCHAIKIIHHENWPAMMGYLGFTKQDSDILLGFCDAFDDDDKITNTQTLPPLSPTTIEG